MSSERSPYPWWIYCRPWLGWLCRFPLLLLVTLAVLGGVWGLGRDYGIPYLFWHEQIWPQFFAGTTAALLLGLVCFTGYMLECPGAWLKQPPPLWLAESIQSLPGFRFVAGVFPRSLWWYLAVTWPWLLLALMLRAWVPMGGPGGIEPGTNLPAETFNSVGKWPFLFGVVASVPLLGASALAAAWLHNWPVFEDGLRRLPRLRDEPDEVLRLHALAAAQALLLISVFTALALLPDHSLGTPIVATGLLIGFTLLIYGFLRFHLSGTINLVVVAGLLLLGLAGRDDYRLQFPGLEPEYDRRKSLDSLPPPNPRLIDSRAALDAWLARAKQRDRRPRLIVIATSGGGIRAAVWTALVMTELEARQPGFSEDVRFISGASGGMVGAAVFVARLDALRSRLSKEQRDALLEEMVDGLAKDSLTPVVRRMVLNDVPMAFWPGRNPRDRGRALEDAWAVNLGGAIDLPFADLRAAEAEGRTPSLVFSPMMVEDGRRILISNLNLDRLTRSRGPFAPPGDVEPADETYSISAVELFRLFPEAADRFTLATAARMSASFPYVSPAVALPTDPPRHVVDAGYYDNYGVNLAANWLDRHAGWIEDNARDLSGVVLIQICDSLRAKNRLNLVLESERRPPIFLDAVEALTAPPQGVFQAREAAMAFRNDEQVEALSFWLNMVDPGRFTTFAIECPTPASLSWYLTRAEVAAMRASVRVGDRRLEPRLQAAEWNRLREEAPGLFQQVEQNRDKLSQMIGQAAQSEP